ncbi:MAG TPA: hypothetical protein VJH55_03160 [Candidatus Paceibacterota bacterium]
MDIGPFSSINVSLETLIFYFKLFTPIAIPFLLGLIFWHLWKEYVRRDFINKEEYILLELRLPKDTWKGPAAMELVLNQFYQTGGENTFLDRWWRGKVRPWFSLEIVSIEGQVKFYISLRKAWRRVIESALYSQYPEVEIYEAPDYAKSVHFDPKEYKIWTCNFVKSHKLQNAYPIKTYVDYGLTKDDMKEEFKIDPMTQMIEALGALGSNEQVWIQFIARAHKGEQLKPGTFLQLTDEWKDSIKAEVKKIILDFKKKMNEDNKEDERAAPFQLTAFESNIIESLERYSTKYPFDVGIRALYITKPDSFAPTGVPGLISMFRQYGAPNLNGFKPTGGSASFDYPWQDFMELRHNLVRKAALSAYKRRCYFYAPCNEKSFVMNAEELATIYHLPGNVSRTPTLSRIESKKAQAPGNLPI